MSDLEKIKKKLHTAFKISGFSVRREFCGLIVEKLLEEAVPINDNSTFETYLKNLCLSLEKQCLSDKSIEKEHIDHAIEVCLKSGLDKNETVFSVISAFDFPKLQYDRDRKLYLSATKKSTFLSDPLSKAQLFIDRYTAILQRTQHYLKLKQVANENDRVNLQSVDYLLTVTNTNLDKTLILGSLLQVSEGKYYIEDPSGIVQLNLSEARFEEGFFVENSFVLVTGYYEDKILNVSRLILPPGEEYNNSKFIFGSVNYFGGPSETSLRGSQNLQNLLQQNRDATMVFLSNVWLDHAMVFEKLAMLFQGMADYVRPVAFIFMGNFMEELHGLEKMLTLKKLFKQLGELISKHPGLVANSHFVFVPGMSDPSTPHTVPRFPLPSHITEDLKKHVPKAIFTTNPCRIQYCNKEIVVFRADVLAKLMQGTISPNKPDKKDVASYVTKTIISHGHLSPLSLNALTVHWDFDYTLRLYPLPNLIVIGDKSEGYKGLYQGCQVVNPGSFCEMGFQFISYTPAEDLLDECTLDTD